MEVYHINLQMYKCTVILKAFFKPDITADMTN